MDFPKIDFLKGKFDDELVAEIDPKTGEVKVAGYSFTPDVILKGDSYIYDAAFSDWLEQKKEDNLIKAEEILGLYRNNKRRFRNLKESYKRGVVIPFLGAGMSIPSGYPGWTNFLLQLCNDTEVSEKDLMRLLSDGKYEEAAQMLADNMPIGSFSEAIDNTFGHDEKLKGPVQLFPYIFQTSLITTNFDNVIKRCYDTAGLSFSETLSGVEVQDLSKCLGKGNRVLVKLHGKANSGRSRVLTSSEYKRHYEDQPYLRDAIEAICTKTLLFVGCSLCDDRTIKMLTQHSEEKGPDIATRHYAFLSIGEEENLLARRDYIERANIFPIWYPAEEDHDECIEALLYKLVE